MENENLLCCAADVLEGRGIVQVAITVVELLKFHNPANHVRSPTRSFYNGQSMSPTTTTTISSSGSGSSGSGPKSAGSSPISTLASST
ncbi:hypothetical protein pipiens_009715 [Culex pipiens pipiens]|uniref:Uncharacterized protein n=1 Tax=Culex pipiens pipiens TaxID=38569 RepID=A0ABD1DCU0_CULPP